MSDNSRRAGQWLRLVGEFFVPRLGGTAGQWADANNEVFPKLFAEVFMPGPLAAQSMEEWERYYAVEWSRRMIGHVGVAVSEDEDELFRLSRAAEAFIIPQTKADFPGAAEALEQLSDAGFKLFTSSGSTSWELEQYIASMGRPGIRGRFERLYGRDLIQQVKSGPEFYGKIFEDSGVNPAVSLVLDDSEKSLDWAASHEAQTLLVGSKSERHRSIGALAELPAMLGVG